MTFEPLVATSDALGEALFGDPDLNAFAVVDGAACLDLIARLDAGGVPNASLFLGEVDPEVDAVAPRLVALSPDAAFDALVKDGWGHAWAIFLTARGTLSDLRRHFRKLTLVELPDRRTVYFRFYDPRVLRHVLPLLDDRQRRQFYGDRVAAYLCEDEGGQAMLEFRRPDGLGAPQAQAAGR